MQPVSFLTILMQIGQRAATGVLPVYLATRCRDKRLWKRLGMKAAFILFLLLFLLL